MIAIPLLLAAVLTGVPVHYRLPLDGPLPRTWRVTLAVTPRGNPDAILSTFLAGAPRTVTAENQGRLTDEWNGLDDNFMPLPPGTYGLKGIVMPAERWPIDGQWHSVVPRYLGAADAWAPNRDEDTQPFAITGDPCGQPLGDVDVAPGGRGVAWFVYLENAANNYLLDFTRPPGRSQVLGSFGSGSAAGGPATCTDGTNVWSFSTDGGPKFVFRADGRPFGHDQAARRDVYRPAGWVTALAAAPVAGPGQAVIYVAQRGRLVETPEHQWAEDERQPVDKVAWLQGADGRPLGELSVAGPTGLVARGGQLYVLHRNGAGWRVSVAPLRDGLPTGPLATLCDVPAALHPFDLEVDGAGRLYLSDAAANHVYQLDRSGQILHRYGRLDAQLPGRWDRESFIAPSKLACWRDAEGLDRLLVVEAGGPNRLSEWAADGRLLRDWLTPQTRANDGFAVDPEHPEWAYVLGQQNWLTRFRIDYERGTWTIDAVWPHVGDGPLGDRLARPKVIRRDGHTYLAFGRNQAVYRLEGDRWLASAAVLHEGQTTRLWHDADGDGRIGEAEKTTITPPPGTSRYHGEMFADDLSILSVAQGSRTVQRLAPARFDALGNPAYEQWQPLLTDPVFEARAKGEVPAAQGGNECADSYSSDWAQCVGSEQAGYWVQARGGPNFSANFGAQIKLSRYVPDSRGSYRLRWRVGRTALQGAPQAGEMAGTIFLTAPTNGILSVTDQSRAGLHLFTDDGLFVDTLFPASGHGDPKLGVYPQPGEFFAGYHYLHRGNGQVYVAFGKTQPAIYECRGWSATSSPVRPLPSCDATVGLTAAQVATPPEIALTVRGGAGTARVARFAPLPGGGPALDGAPRGWEVCEPVRYAAGPDQSVEVRCGYDPEHLYLRYGVRLGRAPATPELQPAEQLFTHERGADTVGFYLQGDPNATGTTPAGRPGDLRVVLGLFRDGGTVRPVALGLWPKWRGPAAGRAQVYRTPVGEARFEHVGLLEEARLGYQLDADGKGFVIAAALPRTALPPMPAFDGALRTLVDFDANFGGHQRVWWSNADGSANRETYDAPSEARLYPGAWSPALWQGLSGALTLRNWLVCGPWGGPGAEGFGFDLGGGEKERYANWQKQQTWPLDNRVVEPDAVFRGDRLAGYWGRPAELRWQPRQTAGIETRIPFGGAAQVWYAASWIHAPAETAVAFRIQGWPQTWLSVYAGDHEVFAGEVKGEPGQGEVSRPMTLPAGWTQVWLRGWCTGYPPFRAGLVVEGEPAALWRLRLSPDKP